MKEFPSLVPNRLPSPRAILGTVYTTPFRLLVRVDLGERVLEKPPTTPSPRSQGEVDDPSSLLPPHSL
jgi:hypothetical protein